MGLIELRQKLLSLIHSKSIFYAFVNNFQNFIRQKLKAFSQTAPQLYFALWVPPCVVG
jgi:hypothetical protein